MLDNLRSQIVKDFEKQYSLNDGAHQIDHFAEVEKCANTINQKLQLGFSSKLILLTSYFHDLFCWSRNNHHLLSYEWVQSTDYVLIEKLAESERTLIKLACLEHRASNRGVFSNKFSELMSAADRELPKSAEDMIQRSIKYHISNGKPSASARSAAVAHIKEKFGTNGYARYPDMYVECFTQELAELRKEIDSIKR